MSETTPDDYEKELRAFSTALAREEDKNRELRAEVDRLVSGLLSASIHSNSTLMLAKLMETLEATRHPDVDHWMGRNLQRD